MASRRRSIRCADLPPRLIASASRRTRLLLTLASVAVAAATVVHAERADRRVREPATSSPYILATFTASGTSWVHVEELRATRHAGRDGQRSVQAVKQAIRDAARRAPGAASDLTDEQIVLTGLWAFDGMSHAATEARSHACRLEAQGYRPWVASACGALPRAPAPRAAASAPNADEARALTDVVATVTPSVRGAARGTEAPAAPAPARPPARRGRAPILDLGALWRTVLPFVPLVLLVLFVGPLRRALSATFRLPFRLVGRRLPTAARSRAWPQNGSSADTDAATDIAAQRRARHLAHQPLRQIARSEVLLEHLARMAAAAVADDGTGPLAGRAVPATWLARHGEALRRAATETNLTPALVGTVVLAEQRGVPGAMPIETAITTEIGRFARELRAAIDGTTAGDDARLLVFAGELLARGTTHALAFFDEYVSARGPASAVRDIVVDIAATQLPDGLPLGLGQRDVASLVDLGIHRDARLGTEWKLDGLADRALRRELRRRLLDEPDNVRLCAKVVRTLADMAAELARRRPDLARKALDVAAVPAADVEANRLLTFVQASCEGRLDLSKFAQHPDDWTPGHVSFIGWRYHARHLGATDTVHGDPRWAARYLAAFADIARSRGV